MFRRRFRRWMNVLRIAKMSNANATSTHAATIPPVAAPLSPPVFWVVLAEFDALSVPGVAEGEDIEGVSEGVVKARSVDEGVVVGVVDGEVLGVVVGGVVVGLGVVVGFVTGVTTGTVTDGVVTTFGMETLGGGTTTGVVTLGVVVGWTMTVFVTVLRVGVSTTGGAARPNKGPSPPANSANGIAARPWWRFFMPFEPCIMKNPS